MAGDEKTGTSRESDRRRVEEVFGEILPETTTDERGTERPDSEGDSWYLENRPPHHDH